MPAPLHIGIVACSAEGAALCYRTICIEGARRLGGHAHPEVTMHTPPLSAYMERIDRDDWDGVGAQMLASAAKLAAAGADFLICPDNTLHRAFAYVASRSPLPWLHIAEVVAATANARGYRRLGLTGTHWLVRSEVYPQALSAAGIEYVRPDAETCARMGRIIMDELVRGVFRAEAVDFFRGAIDTLKAQGCDAVVLGCTEIPLIIDDANASLPTLDSTRLLATAAVARAIADVDAAQRA
jgi:aspartate racemase